jgi:enoyl-CoA hydratase/carnithine racemase
MLGTTIDAEDALRIGLVNRVVPAGRLLDEAALVAQALAAKPPAALRAVKAVARRIAALELFAGMQLEGEQAAAALQDPENVRRAAEYFAGLRGKA